jgi:hypothetical protein
MPNFRSDRTKKSPGSFHALRLGKNKLCSGGRQARRVDLFTAETLDVTLGSHSHCGLF